MSKKAPFHVTLLVRMPDGTVREPDDKERARIGLFLVDMFSEVYPVAAGEQRGAGVRKVIETLSQIPVNVLKHWGG